MPAHQGGKTCLANEVAVCTTCHALVHAGLLRVTGNANEELCWSPAAAEPGKRSTGDEQSSDDDSRPESTTENGTAKRGGRLDLEALAHGLARLGVPIVRSRRIIGVVVKGLPRDELTEASVLRTALAAI